jgi:hypothetical protein
VMLNLKQPISLIATLSLFAPLLVPHAAASSTHQDPNPTANYQQLASHFQHTELRLRAQAQQSLDAAATRSPRYRMATKLVSWAEATARTHETLLRKATQNARLAKACEQILSTHGISPPIESRFTVSLLNLQKTPPAHPSHRSSCVP